MPARSLLKVLIIVFCFFLPGSAWSQDELLCQGHYRTEDEANLMMKRFRALWDSPEQWEERAEVIRNGLLISDGGDWTRNIPRIEYPYIREVYALDDALAGNQAVISYLGFDE